MKFQEEQDFSFSNTEKLNTTISTEKLGLVMNIMSSKLYADKYSFIRELVSNAYDAHLESEITKPIIIELVIDELNKKKLLFKDFGLGMSDQVFRKIYSTWFESTKRNSNNPLGMYGLGSKSPLAYNNSYKITTHSVEDNTTRTYVVSKGSSTPEIHLINTLERPKDVQGTIVEIDLHEYETEKSIQKLVESHTLYFDTIFFEGFSDPDINNFTIIDKKNFRLHSKHYLINEPHIVMGPVMYKVPQLTFKYNMPIGIKFEIGELMVPPSRETVEITKESERLIQERYDAALNEIVSLYNHLDESAPYYSPDYEYYIQLEDIKFNLPRTFVNGRKLLPKINTIFANSNYFYFVAEHAGYFIEKLFDFYEVKSWGTSGLKYKVESTNFISNYFITIKENVEISNTLVHLHNNGVRDFYVKRIRSKEDFIEQFTYELDTNYKCAALIELHYDHRVLGEFIYEHDVRKKEFELYYGAVYDQLYARITFTEAPTIEEEQAYQKLWKDHLKHTKRSYSKEEILIHYVSNAAKQDWKQVKTIEELMNEKKTLFVLFTDRKDADKYKILHSICDSYELGFMLNVTTKTQFALVSKRNEQKLLETSSKFKSMETISIELLQAKIPKFIKTIVNFLYISETLDVEQLSFIRKHKEILIRLNKDWEKYFNLAIFTSGIQHEFYSHAVLNELAEELRKWSIDMNLNLIDPQISDAIFLIKTLHDKLDILDHLNIKAYDISPEILTKVAKIAILHKLKLNSAWYNYEKLLEYPYKHVINNFLWDYEKELIEQAKERELYMLGTRLNKPAELYSSASLKRTNARKIINKTHHLKYDESLTQSIIYNF